MDLGSAELDGLLSQTRAMLESFGARPPAEGAEDARGIGAAADGRVTAVAVGGRLESLKLDPRVMRMASEDLAGHDVLVYVAVIIDAEGNALASEDRYFYECETPSETEELGYYVSASGDHVTYDEVAKAVARHLRIQRA